MSELGRNAAALIVEASVEQDHCLLHLAGALDLSTRHQIHEACRAGTDASVVLDLTDLTFMDCAGYGGMVTTRTFLEGQGGTLTWRNQVGEPARLLDLIR